MTDMTAWHGHTPGDPMPSTLPDLLGPQMPDTFVAELAELARASSARQQEHSVSPGRWLTVEEMRPGDKFVYAAFGSEEVLTVGPLGVPPELARRWAARGLAPLAVEGEPLPMQLPRTDRWRMVRALRHAAVHCLVCGEADGLGERTYDLADPETMHVEAVCLTCAHATTGGAP